jgi:hypothetical protein
MEEKEGAFTGIFVLFFICLGIFQLVLGYLGIEHHLGAGWAIGAVVAAFMFRFTLPLTVGTFFGVLDVLEWNWFFALLVTAPGLIFMIPSVLLAIVEAFSSKSRSYN